MERTCSLVLVSLHMIFDENWTIRVLALQQVYYTHNNSPIKAWWSWQRHICLVTSFSVFLILFCLQIKISKRNKAIEQMKSPQKIILKLKKKKIKREIFKAICFTCCWYWTSSEKSDLTKVTLEKVGTSKITSLFFGS